MPPKSKAQHRAMRAAAAGKSTLGIPASVGKEYVKDVSKKSLKKLPARAKKKSKRKKR